MKRLHAIIIAYASLALSVQAQVTSLRECLQMGLDKNYSLRITRNEEQVTINNATKANAGYLPTVGLSASYGGTLDNTSTTARESGVTSTDHNFLNQTFNAGINLDWTLFDGFKISTNYEKLKELRRKGQIMTRITVEDFMANLTSEYYNYVQQKIRLKNLRYAVSLSRERLRIVEERYLIGSFSRLDLQQANVDFNSDSSMYVKQQELLATSRIRLNELMANENVNDRIHVKDTVINVEMDLNYGTLWNATLQTNASLIQASQNKTLAEIDFKSVRSRDYPYVKLNTGYSYTHNRYGVGSSSKKSDFGLDFGLSVGFKLFDGNRRRERRNAQIAIDNAELERQNLQLGLKSDLSNLWQAYQNNRKLLKLERENLIAAKENHLIARERYLLGNLSGIEMREAQKSLLDAEERILTAEYNTKLCEISLLQLSGQITYYLK